LEYSYCICSPFYKSNNSSVTTFETRLRDQKLSWCLKFPIFFSSTTVNSIFSTASRKQEHFPPLSLHDEFFCRLLGSNIKAETKTQPKKTSKSTAARELAKPGDFRMETDVTFHAKSKGWRLKM